MESYYGNTRLMQICFGLLLLITSSPAQGAFKADPPHISPSETDILTLKCTPEGSADSSVLALQIKKVVDDGRSRKKRSVHRVKRVVGSTLYQATLTSGDSVGIVPNIDRFEGFGKMAQPAFLTVKMAKPDVDDAGDYECSVTAMNSDGVKVTRQNVTVTAGKVLNLDSLEGRVQGLEHQLPVMAAIGQSMQRIAKEDKEKYKQLETDVQNLKKENKDLVVSVEELMKKFRTLSERTVALMQEQKLQMDELKKSHEDQKQKFEEHQKKYEKQQQQQQEQQQQQTQQQQQQPQQPPPSYQNSNQFAQAPQQGNMPPQGSSINRVGETVTSTDGLVDSSNGGAKNQNQGQGQRNVMPGNGYGIYNNNPNPNNGMPGNGYIKNPNIANGYVNPYNGGMNNNNYYDNGYNNYNNIRNPYNPFQGVPYNNNRGGVGGAGNMAPPAQYGNYPYNNNINNNINNNNVRGQMLPPGYGNGFQQPQMPQMPQQVPHLKTDDLFRIKARMDDLENTRLASLEQQMAELRHQWIDPISTRLNDLDLYINGTVAPSLQNAVDPADYFAVEHRVSRLEGVVMPQVINNITSMQKHIVKIHRAMDKVQGLKNASADEIASILKTVGRVSTAKPIVDAETGRFPKTTTLGTAANTRSTTHHDTSTETPTSPSPTSTVKQAQSTLQNGTKEEEKKEEEEKGEKEEEATQRRSIATTTAPAPTRVCHMCGNNKTEESCTPHTKDDQSDCYGDNVFCMTDIYQNGMSRDVYKRCATKEDCKAVRNSDSKCAKTSFMTVTTMECHFCCTSDLCNTSIRPTKDVYKG